MKLEEEELRRFLEAEKVRIPGKKEGRTPFIPQSAPPEQVCRYEDDKIGGPDMAQILIAWDQPLSAASPWNEDAITLHAEKARQSLTASKTKHTESWLELPELKKQITRSLRQTKMIINTNTSYNPKATTMRQRRRARKISVGDIFLLVRQSPNFCHRKLRLGTE